MGKSYQTIGVRFENEICYLQINRPESNNTINARLIEECIEVVDKCRASSVHILVLEGSPTIFCLGADFNELKATQGRNPQDPKLLYLLWLQLAESDFISVAHVRGKVNAGGVGFVAACDIVLADDKAIFGLSELLFGLLPACVLPFLIQKIGWQKAQYMTLMTKSISVQDAYAWGLVDAFESNSDILLKKHLLRLKCLPQMGIARFKKFKKELNRFLNDSQMAAILTNNEVFSDQKNIKNIHRYVETGTFPWE